MQQWVSQFFSQVHRDYLKKLGFKKTRHTFSRDMDTYWERFSIQGSAWNSGQPNDPWFFYINVGVEFKDWSGPVYRSSFHHTHWRERIEFILPELMELGEYEFELPPPPDVLKFAQPLAESIEDASQQVASRIEEIRQCLIGERTGPVFSRYEEGYKPVIRTMQQSWIMFHNSAFGLDEAFHALSQRGGIVTRQQEVLCVRWNQGPVLCIGYTCGQMVHDETMRLSKTLRGKPYASILRACDARFEISFDNFDAALDEINTLIDVQLTLQDATQGLLYNTWNKVFSTPD